MIPGRLYGEHFCRCHRSNAQSKTSLLYPHQDISICLALSDFRRFKSVIYCDEGPPIRPIKAKI